MKELRNGICFPLQSHFISWKKDEANGLGEQPYDWVAEQVKWEVSVSTLLQIDKVLLLDS